VAVVIVVVVVVVEREGGKEALLVDALAACEFLQLLVSTLDGVTPHHSLHGLGQNL
jgi:hypothetical protein